MPTATGRPTAAEKRATANAKALAVRRLAAAPFAEWAAPIANDLAEAAREHGFTAMDFADQAHADAIQFSPALHGAMDLWSSVTMSFVLMSKEPPVYGLRVHKRSGF